MVRRKINEPQKSVKKNQHNQRLLFERNNKTAELPATDQKKVTHRLPIL